MGGIRRRRFRWTAERRSRVLEALAETGNKTAAAAAAGARYSSLSWLRSQDGDFDRQCRAAEAAAQERLEAAEDPFAEGDGFHAIRRTSNGRYQLTAVGKGCWTKRHDDIFFTNLRRTGNIGASARATGFDESSVWDRYYKWPAFRQRWEQVLDEASLVLEFRLACEGNQVRLGRESGADCRHRREGGDPEPLSSRAGAAESPALDSRFRGNDGEGRGNDGEGRGNGGQGRGDGGGEARLDPEFALRFLKWREDKKNRGRRRGPMAKRPPIEEVAENIIRKVEAIKRHREKGRTDGDPA